jgi:hypothetical protein
MSHVYEIEYTDTFSGEANYSWVRRARVEMPDLTAYGFDGSRHYAKANAIFERELMRKAKAKMGLTNMRGSRTSHGDTIEFRPYGSNTVLFINYGFSDGF